MDDCEVWMRARSDLIMNASSVLDTKTTTDMQTLLCRLVLYSSFRDMNEKSIENDQLHHWAALRGVRTKVPRRGEMRKRRQKA